MPSARATASGHRGSRVEAQERFLAAWSASPLVTIDEALEVTGRRRGWYEAQRREDPEFRARVDTLRAVRERPDPNARLERAGSFTEFSEKYLRLRVNRHTANIVDLLEGRDPGWGHPSFTFERGTAGGRRLLVTVPPNHAKSMAVTIGYSTYRICRDPNVRIIIVSKTMGLAHKFLSAVKNRLTHPQYRELQVAFAPDGGFQESAQRWTAGQIVLGGDEREAQEKDPTAEALGFGSQIYGARADLIILDDVVTLSNAADYEKQMDWIRQEVASRLGPGGMLLVIGTRVAPVDLYKELRNPDHYTDGASPWTYLAMPAVLDYGSGDPADWETLWPTSDQPFSEGDVPDEDGLFPRWTGERLAVVRNEVGPSKWGLVYQQMDVSEEAVFNQIAVRGCVNGVRKPGPLRPGALGHPKDTAGFYTLCAMDPAMAGDTATVAYTVDRESGRRWVLDVNVMRAPTPTAIRDLIREWTERYSPFEWIIEQNAFQLFLTQDPEITRFLQARGIPLRGHFTGRNKMDEDFGVATLAPLFGSTVQKDRGGEKHAGDNLIDLPDVQGQHGPKLLVEQLVTWIPGRKPKHLKQDTVMALWMADLRARELVSAAQSQSTWFLPGRWSSERDEERQMVVNLDELAGNPAMSFL